MTLLQSDLDFAFWLGGRRSVRVRRERSETPRSEVRRRKYDEETERLRRGMLMRRVAEEWKAARGK